MIDAVPMALLEKLEARITPIQKSKHPKRRPKPEILYESSKKCKLIANASTENTFNSIEGSKSLSCESFDKLSDQPNITSFFAPKNVLKPRETFAEAGVVDKPKENKSHLPIRLTEPKSNLEVENIRLNKIILELRNDKIQEQNLMDRMKDELDRANNKLRLERGKIEKVNLKYRRILIDLITERDYKEYVEEQKQAAAKEFEIGKVVNTKSKMSAGASQQKWQNGERSNDIEFRNSVLKLKQKRIEHLKKELGQLKKQYKMKSKRMTGVDYAQIEESNYDRTVTEELEIVEKEERIKVLQHDLKKEHKQLYDDNERLRCEKILFIRLLKRVNYQNNSYFADKEVLNTRYILRNLIGKGGFSEVWRAFDLIDIKDVAIKFHQVDNNWGEQKRRRYMTHVQREYNIMKTLSHKNIVKLENIFEHSASILATVLEFCPGESEETADLDIKIKLRKCLPEREARAILLQILSGLRYLNTGQELEFLQDQEIHNSYEPTKAVKHTESVRTRRHKSIIHYDLKPANILFDEFGNVKISDFGLSKIMQKTEADDSSGMELTSQFAGTYWYLPPECFFVSSSESKAYQETDKKKRQDLGISESQQLKISSKVDVWSVGVIYYQMLFGKKPFGDGLTPKRILLSQTILDAMKVEFPENPAVSNEAKKFISKCLTYRQSLRPDVIELCKDPYLRRKRV